MVGIPDGTEVGLADGAGPVDGTTRGIQDLTHAIIIVMVETVPADTVIILQADTLHQEITEDIQEADLQEVDIQEVDIQKAEGTVQAVLPAEDATAVTMSAQAVAIVQVELLQPMEDTAPEEEPHPENQVSAQDH